MYIKRSYLAGLAVVGAGFLGWFMHSSTAATQAAPGAPAAAVIAPPVDAGDRHGTPTTADADQPPIVLSLTITDGRIDGSLEPEVVAPSAGGIAPSAANQPAAPGSDPAVATSSASDVPSGGDRASGATGHGPNPSGQHPATTRGATRPHVTGATTSSPASTASPHGRIIAIDTAAAFPSGERSSATSAGAAGSATGLVSSVGPPGGSGVTMLLTPQMAVTAIGEHIVIALDDSIVLVGDDASLLANTGDADQAGVVALDSQGSTFSSANEAAPDPDPSVDATVTTAGTGQSGQSAVSPLTSPIVSFSDGRAVDIAGYEDHSLTVRGARNVVTYDDSNVFVDRDGQINANTGDTDSAGLNAVDTVRSRVSAGPHCDDGCDDESIIQAEAGVFDEGDVAIDGDGNVVWAPDGDDDVADDPGDDDSLPSDNGDDDDADDDESEDGDVSDPVEAPETREEADSTREAADSGLDPAQVPVADSLVIGGDGYDDLGLRVEGDDQVITYDDSNVVIGGTGDVNAQIGDSDTGGTVSMHTVDSEVAGGNSR